MTALKIDDRVYDIEAKFEMICELEDELGSLPDLAMRFMGDGWKVSELVTMTHIVLSHIGKNIDYMELGNRIINDGISEYIGFANGFLKSVVYK